MRTWTTKQRAALAEKCRQLKPWRYSTGPRTQAGKDKSKMNAYKHGFRGREMDEVKRLLNYHRTYINHVFEYGRYRKQFDFFKKRTNELVLPDLSFSQFMRGIAHTGPPGYEELFFPPRNSQKTHVLQERDV